MQFILTTTPRALFSTFSRIDYFKTGMNIYTISLSNSDCVTIVCKLIPPFSFFLKMMFGGSLFSRMPKPSNSFSINLLCCKGFNTSSTMKIKEQVRATAITCFFGKWWSLIIRFPNLRKPLLRWTFSKSLNVDYNKQRIKFKWC